MLDFFLVRSGPGRVVAGALAMATAMGSLGACSSGGDKVAEPASTTVTSTTSDAPVEVWDPDSFDPQNPPGEARPPVTLKLVPIEGSANVGAAEGIQPWRGAGPVRLKGTSSPGWHTIDRTPAKMTPGSHRTYPGGTRQEWDADNPASGLTTYGPGGSIDTIYDDGTRSHLGSGGYEESPGMDGPFDPGDTYDEVGPDGRIHLGPPETGGDYFEDPQGNRRYFDDGDGELTLPPPTYGPPPPAGKAPSGGIGEPHYLTEDGASLTTQLLGEFILTTGVPGQVVQARTEPWKDSDSAASITALAFGVDDQRVTIDVDGTVRVDGTPAPDGTDLEFGFDDGGQVGVWREAPGGAADQVVVVWPDLSVAWVEVHDGWLSFRLQWRQETGDRIGLLGSDDGDPANDLTERGGQVVEGGQADAEPEAVDSAVRSWMVSETESLFDYGAGESTATFRDDSFPREIPESSGDSAVEACEDVPEGFARDACIYDVGLTGDETWVDPARGFGDAIAADRALREAFEVITQVFVTLGLPRRADDEQNPSNGSAGADEISLTDGDRSMARDLEADGSLDVDVAAGESATFRLEVTERSNLYALNNNLSCPNAAFAREEGGFAYLDEGGSVVAGPDPACDDSDKVVVAAGTYYLKVVGPATLSLGLEAVPVE